MGAGVRRNIHIGSVPKHSLYWPLYFSASSFTSPCRLLIRSCNIFYHRSNLRIILSHIFQSFRDVFVDHISILLYHHYYCCCCCCCCCYCQYQFYFYQNKRDKNWTNLNISYQYEVCLIYLFIHSFTYRKSNSEYKHETEKQNCCIYSCQWLECVIVRRDCFPVVVHTCIHDDLYFELWKKNTKFPPRSFISFVVLPMHTAIIQIAISILLKVLVQEKVKSCTPAHQGALVAWHDI